MENKTYGVIVVAHLQTSAKLISKFIRDVNYSFRNLEVYEFHENILIISMRIRSENPMRLEHAMKTYNVYSIQYTVS